MKRAVLLVFSAVFCCLCLVGCAEPVPTDIEFSSGRVELDVQDLSIVLQPGETQLLDSLEQLQTADFSGSERYDEIFEWAQKNPDVDVLYTIALPDGTVVDNHIQHLDLSETEPKLFTQTAQLMKYMPELESVDLSADSREVSVDDFANISSVKPELTYSAVFKLRGQKFSSSAKALDMTGISAEEAEDFSIILPSMKELESVELGDQESSPELEFAHISAMQKACPQADFAYSFQLFDQSFTTADTSMNLAYTRMYDNGAAVMEAISCMPRLEYLDMDSCHVPDEDMAKIRDAYPNVKVVWRVWFGDNYCVRTDAEKILASMPSVGGELTPENTTSLKYCTEIKYIDVGHNNYLTDISFVNYMPNLEAAIFAMDFITDVSPLANCPKLEFLEIQTSKVSDISPLADLTNLRHLNICYLYELDDISPIMDLELERLWIGDLSPVPAEQIEEYRKRHPNCRISTENRDPHDGGWRYDQNEKGVWGMHPRYELLVKQFGYDAAAYSFPWKDPLYRYH